MSEPTFRVASTTALPPPTCTARREAGQHHLLAVVLLRGLYRPDRLQQLFFKACAGQIICRLCLPAAALFCWLCLPAITFAIHTFCPHQFAPWFCFDLPYPLFISMCARIVVQSCKNCPVGSYNTGLQWRPVRRLTFSFPAEFIDPGPWFSVKL